DRPAQRRGADPRPGGGRLMDASPHDLVVSHQPLVAGIAAVFRRQGHGRIGMLAAEDLVQEGHVALVRASRTFDPSRGCPFAAHARRWVRSAMIRAIRRAGPPAEALAAEPPDRPDRPVPWAGLTAALERLNPVERLVIDRRYGLGEADQPG